MNDAPATPHSDDVPSDFERRPKQHIEDGRVITFGTESKARPGKKHPAHDAMSEEHRDGDDDVPLGKQVW